MTNKEIKNLLTEQCKTDFEAWLIPFLRSHEHVGQRYYDETLIRDFYNTYPAMQFGVYQYFFQSKDIVFSFKYNGYSFDEHRYRGQIIAFTSGKGEREVIKSNSLNDIRKNLISTSNQLYNEKHKKS